MTARVPASEFEERVRRLQEGMGEASLDAVLVYGDEYRKENLRYISNYWPLFERAAALVPRDGQPVLLAAPECAAVAQEMSPWKDIRNLKEFACVTVPEEIDYPLASFTSLGEVAAELGLAGGTHGRIGVVGLDAMAVNIHRCVAEAFRGSELVDAAGLILDMRLLKSPAEVGCLKEAARIADLGYEVLMAASVSGNTELEAAAAAEGKARAAGAEYVPFTVYTSGSRTDTIIGRPTRKLIRRGEMVMAALAVQYEGYVATVGFPFVVMEGPESLTPEQRELIAALLVAEERGLAELAAWRPAREFVQAVKGFFRERGLDKYDLYPPLHGCGCAEAESPYPDEKSEAVLVPGMTVNVDISLFGHPGGSNRIEEGFVITGNGPEPLSPLVRRLHTEWLGRV